MTAIIIRRIIGGAIFVAGLFLLENEIGVKGSLGVFLVSAGLMVVGGYMRGLLSIPSQELKAKQEEKTTAT